MGRNQKLKEARRVAKQIEKEADQTVELTIEQIEALLERLENRALLEADYPLLIWIVQNYTAVEQKLASRETSMKRLQNLLFGPKSESTKRVGDKPQEIATGASGEKPKRPGHGRKNKDEWAERPLLCPHAHDSLQAGALCPKCKQGKLYEYKPAVHVRIKANPLFEVEHHEMQRLRCSACGWLFTAKMPQDLQKSPSATPEAIALTAMLRYQAGFPKYRLLGFLKLQGIFLTWTKLWGLVVVLFEILLPVFNHLKVLAREGRLVQNDDTRMKVLERSRKKNQVRATALVNQRLHRGFDLILFSPLQPFQL
jgi:transposase